MDISSPGSADPLLVDISQEPDSPPPPPIISPVPFAHSSNGPSTLSTSVSDADGDESIVGEEKWELASQSSQIFMNGSYFTEEELPYQVGDLVWASVNKFPYWPAIVCQEYTSGVHYQGQSLGFSVQ